MPISQNGIWAPRRIQYCTRSHLNLEYLPRLRPELLYSKNLGERVQRRVFHNQARCQNIPKREVLGEHWLAKKKKKAITEINSIIKAKDEWTVICINFLQLNYNQINNLPLKHVVPATSSFWHGKEAVS